MHFITLLRYGAPLRHAPFEAPASRMGSTESRSGISRRDNAGSSRESFREAEPRARHDGAELRHEERSESRIGFCAAWVFSGLLVLSFGAPLVRADDDSGIVATSAAPETLDQRLARQVDVVARDVPLRTFVITLAKQQGLELRFEEKEIAAQSIPLDRPVSVTKRGLPVMRILERTLKKYGLEPRVEGGVVVIGCLRAQPTGDGRGKADVDPPPGLPKFRVIRVDNDRGARWDIGEIEIDPGFVPDDPKRPLVAKGLIFSCLVDADSPEHLAERFQKHLADQIGADHAICGISDEQWDKLRLAGKREIQAHLRQVDRLCERCAEHFDSSNATVEIPAALFDEARNLSIARHRGLFHPDSLFEKTRGRILTPAQKRKLQAVSALRDAGAAVKFRTDLRPGIREVHLSTRPVTDALLSNLTELPELEALSLDSTQVTDDGLVHFELLQQLTWVDLNRTKVGDNGLKHVARLARLERLELQGTQVTDAGIEHILALKHLKSVDISKTQITEVGVARLQTALPGLNVIR